MRDEWFPVSGRFDCHLLIVDNVSDGHTGKGDVVYHTVTQARLTNYLDVKA